MNRPQSLSRAAFTLVELLVVIGIIAVLIGILLPALNKARESARQVQCMSNMRQLATAVIQFAGDHDGWMPGLAGKDPVGFSSNGKPGSGGDPVKNPSDWIAWHRKIDAITGGPMSGASDQNITYSGLAKYLGATYREHNSADSKSAHDVNPMLESLFRCPSDNLQQRPSAYNDRIYRYSYSMNEFVGNPVNYGPSAPGGAPPLPSAGARNGFKFTGKYSSIKRTSEIILFMCEDEQTIDDGRFRAAPGNWNSAKVNGVASRHRIRSARAKLPNTTFANAPNEDTLGNVCFVDGHADIISRKDGLRQKHTGAFYSDKDYGFE